MTGRAMAVKDNHNLFRLVGLCLAVLMGCLFGCTDQSVPQPETFVKNYQAYISNSVRTSMADNGDVSWTGGDKIWYYSQDGGELRNYVVEEGGEKIDIPLTIATDASYITAVYGTSAISSYTAESMKLGNVVKPVQEGTFVDGHVAVARLTDVNGPTLHFYNLVSYIVFSTRKTFIDYIVFSAADDTPMHSNGNVDVHYEDGVPVPALSGSGGSSIRVNLKGAGAYCIAVLPVTLSEGFVISCYDSQDNLVATATGRNTLSVKRGSIVRLGIIDKYLVDENGMSLAGYDGDDPWDYTGGTGGDIGSGQYGNDQNWGTQNGSNGNLGNGSYNDDYNWNTGNVSEGIIGLGGYGSDVNWGQSGNSQGSMGFGWYLDDYNWNPAVVNDGNINKDGYGDDGDWNSSEGASGGIGHEGYGDDQNWN